MRAKYGIKLDLSLSLVGATRLMQQEPVGQLFTT